mgnify:CR=1 FL=1
MLYNVFNKKRDSSAATETISGSIHSKTIYSLSILLFCEIVKFRRYIYGKGNFRGNEKRMQSEGKNIVKIVWKNFCEDV